MTSDFPNADQYREPLEDCVNTLVDKALTSFKQQLEDCPENPVVSHTFSKEPGSGFVFDLVQMRLKEKLNPLGWKVTHTTEESFVLEPHTFRITPKLVNRPPSTSEPTNPISVSGDPEHIAYTYREMFKRASDKIRDRRL